MSSMVAPFCCIRYACMMQTPLVLDTAHDNRGCVGRTIGGFMTGTRHVI